MTELKIYKQKQTHQSAIPSLVVFPKLHISHDTELVLFE